MAGGATAQGESGRQNLRLPADARAGTGEYGINETTLEKEFPIIDQAVKNLRLQFIDMHAALAAHPEDFPDHVHPNAEGAALMAKAAAAAILTGMDR